jgi:hypothetical protein
MKIPKGVVQRFVIKNISLSKGHRYRTVRVLLFDTRESLTAHYNAWNVSQGWPQKPPDGLFGCFLRNIQFADLRYRKPSGPGASIGDICILSGVPKLEWVLVHECFHAAFFLAGLLRFRLEPEDGRFPPAKYEEFIVSAGEYIAEKACAKIRKIRREL